MEYGDMGGLIPQSHEKLLSRASVDQSFQQYINKAVTNNKGTENECTQSDKDSMVNKYTQSYSTKYFGTESDGTKYHNTKTEGTNYHDTKSDNTGYENTNLKIANSIYLQNVQH